MSGGPWVEEVVLLAGVVALAALVVWLAFRYAVARLAGRVERERTLRELLARMESPERAAAFLATPEGRALLGERAPADRRRQALLVLAGVAALGGALGGALLVLGAHVIDPALAGDRQTALAWGVLLCAVGVAALVLALVVRALVPRAGRGDGGDA